MGRLLAKALQSRQTASIESSQDQVPTKLLRGSFVNSIHTVRELTGKFQRASLDL